MLPNVFRGKYFFIDTINTQETLKLKGVIENCGGIVESVLNKNVTHIVAQSERQDYYRKTFKKSVTIVSHEWIFICANFKKMVPCKRYSPDKRSRVLNVDLYSVSHSRSQSINCNYSLNHRNNTLFCGKQFSTLSLYEEDSVNVNNLKNYSAGEFYAECERLYDPDCDVFFNLETIINTRENRNHETKKSREIDRDLCVSIPVPILIKLLQAVENIPNAQLMSVIEELKIYLNSSILGCGNLLDILYNKKLSKHNGNHVVTPLPSTSRKLTSILKNKIEVRRKSVLRITKNEVNDGDNKSSGICCHVPLANIDHNKLPLTNIVEQNKNAKKKNQPPKKVKIHDPPEIRGSSSLFDSFHAKSYRVKHGIVCTYFNQKNLKLLYRMIRQLGVFEIEESVTDRTTHVICDGHKKTLNLYKALARGCWVLSKQWIILSSQAGRWLYEEKYERIDLNPKFRECRVTRQAYGLNYNSDLFADCGSIYVSDDCNFNKFEVDELICACGGYLLSNSRFAEIVIGKFPTHESNLKVAWVFNSIWNNRLCDKGQYYIK